MFGIYIHFPYCVHKCSYCDFYSIENLNSRNKFSLMLAKEVELTKEHYGKDIFADTLFFGGGTPSLMKPHHFEKIMDSLQSNIQFSPNTEMTMECNPGTIDIKHLEFFREKGINRLSFGVQSFIEKDLKFLERIHNTEDVYKSIETARKIGFDNISIDLIFALPKQSLKDWEYNLNSAIELDTNHISCYSLIYEPGTQLYSEYISGKIEPQNDENDSELYHLTNELLSKAGFEQYEVSNYAKSGYKSRHNLKYWSGEDYFGFGPSAHSFIKGKRYWNYRNNHKYFELLESSKLPIEDSEILSEEQKLFEKIYLGLRAEGINILQLCSQHNISIDSINFNLINDYESNGFLRSTNNFIRLTNKGYFLGDEITIFFSKMLNKEK